MRPLLIDNVARAEAARVKSHAEAHPYRPGPGVAAPGDDPAFVATFGTYRTVFTITHSDRAIWRHLSVSVPGLKLPNQAAVFMIASELYGFTGWDGRTVDRAPHDWLISVNDAERCVVLAQPIGSDAEKAH